MAASYKNYTLVFARARASHRVLLGMKKRGFGAGRWNGFGGKLEPGESARVAASRELREECGLDAEPRLLDARGRLDFHFAGEPCSMRVFVFATNDHRGEPVESEEMRPRWFGERELPFEEMWPDDRHWLPRLLADEHFVGEFWFEGHDRILRQELRRSDADEVERLVEEL